MKKKEKINNLSQTWSKKIRQFLENFSTGLLKRHSTCPLEHFAQKSFLRKIDFLNLFWALDETLSVSFCKVFDEVVETAFYASTETFLENSLFLIDFGHYAKTF